MTRRGVRKRKKAQPDTRVLINPITRSFLEACGNNKETSVKNDSVMYEVIETISRKPQEGLRKLPKSVKNYSLVVANASKMPFDWH